MTSQYDDQDLVYVDPDARKVVGKVKWGKNGNPKPLEMPEKEESIEEDESDKKKDKSDKKPATKRRRKRYYLWGTYRTMKRLYRIEGKEKEVESYKDLDEAMKLAMEEPFWD